MHSRLLQVCKLTVQETIHSRGKTDSESYAFSPAFFVTFDIHHHISYTSSKHNFSSPPISPNAIDGLENTTPLPISILGYLLYSLNAQILKTYGLVPGQNILPRSGAELWRIPMISCRDCVHVLRVFVPEFVTGEHDGGMSQACKSGSAKYTYWTGSNNQDVYKWLRSHS